MDSAEPGQYSVERTPYCREPMECFTDLGIEKIVLMFGAQTGKTSILLNALGYYVDIDPSPILCVMPILEMAKQFSKDRLKPMIESTPELSKKIAPVRARDSGNTMFHISFNGGRLAIAGSNSPSSLSSRSVRILFCDEVDRYESNNEGDPIDLAIRRTATFAHNRKILLTSTPTIKGMSRIETAFEQSDQRFYYLPCPHCKEKQVLKWTNVRWSNNDPKTAHYECDYCKGKWTNGQRLNSLKKGTWKAHSESRGIAGFHLSGLYSPWTSLEQAVEDFLLAKGNPETLKTFINTYLAESWEDEGDKVDNTGLYNRREKYEAEIPTDKILLLVAGADVQDSRIEVEILGIGDKNESWSIDYKIIYGDPSTQLIWDQLTEILTKTFYDINKNPYRITATCIDSGGHFTQQVYSYCKKNMRNRVYAIKGVGGFGRPFVTRPSKNNLGRVYLFPLGVDSIKQTVYHRLKIDKPGEGFCHFPDHYDEEYFKQLTSEKIIKVKRRGYVQRQWVKQYERNESLDCRAYAIGAFSILNIRDIAKFKKVSKAPKQKENQTKVQQFEPHLMRNSAKKRRKGGWAIS